MKSNWFITWGKYATYGAAILGLFGIFFNPIKKLITKKINEKKEFNKTVLTSLTNIEKRLDSITEDVMELQGDNLCRAHAEVMKQGWCSASRKKQLCDWYKSYSGKGGNHQVETYADDILSLPEDLPKPRQKPNTNKR